MTVWLPHYDEGVLDLLRKAMPCVQIETWETVHVDAMKASWREVAQTITGYLANLSPTVRAVSIRRLKRECDLGRMPKKLFQRARDEAVGQVGGWHLVRSSLRRDDF